MSHGLSEKSRLWRYVLPYCLSKVEWKGRAHVYIPLNRNYKPLGYFPQTHGRDEVDYSEHAHQFISFKRDPKSYKGIWWKDEPELYLYDDGEKSRETYFQRLERLTGYGELVVTQLRS